MLILSIPSCASSSSSNTFFRFMIFAVGAIRSGLTSSTCDAKYRHCFGELFFCFGHYVEINKFTLVCKVSMSVNAFSMIVIVILSSFVGNPTNDTDARTRSPTLNLAGSMRSMLYNVISHLLVSDDIIVEANVMLPSSLLCSCMYSTLLSDPWM